MTPFVKRWFPARASLVCVPLVARLAHAPRLVGELFGLLALFVVAEALAALSPARDGVERALFAALGSLVMLVVLGLGLNEVPGQLSRLNWLVGWTIVGLGLTTGAHVRAAKSVSPHGVPLTWAVAVPLLVLSLATIAGLLLADVGTTDLARRPLVSLGVDHWSARSAVVEVDANHVGGDFVLYATGEGRSFRRALVKRFYFDRRQTLAKRVTVALPPSRSSWTITLDPVDGAQASTLARTVILRRPA